MCSSHSQILFHLHRPPLPTDGGDKQRLMGMLNYFRDRSSVLTVDAFGGNTVGRIEWTEEDVAPLQPYVNNFQYYRGETNILDFVYSRSKSFYYQKVLGQQLPIDTDYFAPPNYVQYVKKLVQQKQYDYLWLNYIEYAPLAIYLKKHFKLKILIDIHDLGCQGRLALGDIEYLQKLKFDYQLNLVKEGNLLNKFDYVIVNSQVEKDILSSYVATEKLILIPHLLAETVELKNITPYNQRQFDYDLLFVGTGRSPNVNAINFFLQDIFPQIIKQKPSVTLALVGSINQAIKIPHDLAQNVIDLGFVEDLPGAYLSSRINICPLLKGAGTKVKLQEALAYALPIVTTTTGASGLNLEHEVNAYITDEPQVFATKILTLLDNEQLCQKLAAASSLTFEKHYTKEQVYEKLDLLLEI
ncbi:MAG: glycosyltransferase family 4 protein [Cyanobacteria bacterium J06642_3]